MQENGATVVELDTYYICLLRKGPQWTTEESPESDALQESHLTHTLKLWRSGKTIAAGPINDESDIRGFSVYRTAKLDEAVALANADPGVQAGRFIVELHVWRTPKGSLPAPESRETVN
jgi:uncharacterized protein YciI